MRRLPVLAPALTAVALASAAAAQGFNIDFGTATYQVPPSVFPAAAAQAGTWNLVDAATADAGASLVDLSGASTSAVLTCFPPGVAFNGYFNNTSTNGYIQALLDDFLQADDTTWTFSGLATGMYDVYVYAWAPDVPYAYFTDVTVSGGSAGTVTVGGGGWSTSWVLGRHYMKDRVAVANGTLTIHVDVSAANTPTSVNGLQLVHTACAQPAAYCTAGTTSHGCVPSISGSGWPSASAPNGFTLSVDQVEGQQSGVIFYGITGAVASPWGVGGTSYMCVKAPIERTSPQPTGGTFGLCDGALALDWNAFRAANPTALGQPFAGGALVYAQGWFRDPAAVKTTNLSDALSFQLCP